MKAWTTEMGEEGADGRGAQEAGLLQGNEEGGVWNDS